MPRPPRTLVPLALVTALTALAALAALAACGRPQPAGRPPDADSAPSAAAPSAAAEGAEAPPLAPVAPEAPSLASASPEAPSLATTSPEAPPPTAAGPAGAAPRCPPGEVPIPPTGPEGFRMGRGLRGTSDAPHQVVLTRGFCLDETEVTASRYGECVAARACALPGLTDRYASYPRSPNKPVNMVSWGKARAYCHWRGQRLPTEAEWEWAAAGPEGTRYPWGEGPEPSCGVGIADFTPFGAPKSNPGGNVGCFGGGPSDVKAHAKGVKRWPGGALYDLGGNVWEWCEDSYVPYPKGFVTDPLVRRDHIANHSIRGGAWNRASIALRGAYRASAVLTYQVPGLGFRCARTIELERLPGWLRLSCGPPTSPFGLKPWGPAGETCPPPPPPPPPPPEIQDNPEWGEMP